MSDPTMPTAPPAPTMTESLKNWMIVILTLIFVLLYAGVLIGWIKTTDAINTDVIKNLQPIVFIIIGYYFGRLPAQQNENSLKEEIKRQSNKADAAANAKEKAQQEREALEEKIKNVKAIISSANVDSTFAVSESVGTKGSANIGVGTVETVVKILNS